MKKETLEEFAERLCPNKQVEYDMIIEGAKWQQEISYSELSIYLQKLADKDRLKSLTSNQIRTAIEQFKK